MCLGGAAYQVWGVGQAPASLCPFLGQHALIPPSLPSPPPCLQGAAAQALCALIRLAAARTPADLAASASATATYTAGLCGGSEATGFAPPYPLPHSGPPHSHPRPHHHHQRGTDVSPASASASSGSGMSREHRLAEQQREQRQHQTWPTLASLAPALRWLLLPPLPGEEEGGGGGVPVDAQLAIIGELTG